LAGCWFFQGFENAAAYQSMKAVFKAHKEYPGVGHRPIIAGAAMSLSSVSVISNALRLRNPKLR
jgi:cation transport ATPase